jgi:peptide/nickel transport system ATP-binding protein
MMQSAIEEARDRGGPAQPLISVRQLTKHFVRSNGLFGRRSIVHAVDGISFDLSKGTTLGVVGESGCGKSTMARLLMQMMPADGGDIIFDGEKVGSSALPLREFQRQAQMVFQESYASLNPRMTAETTIAYGLEAFGEKRNVARARARELLSRVGIDVERCASRYPHELSGGQRQRVNIARAIVTHPRLVVLDEAVSALDKSVESQVIDLLLQLKQDMGLTFVFISHDLNTVRYIADNVMVMYLGKVVEIGRAEDVFSNPRHPYTVALLASMPSMNPHRRTEKAPLSGDPPNPLNPPAGCRFNPRCKFCADVCRSIEPELIAAPDAAHQAACHINEPASGHPLADEVASQEGLSFDR